MRIPILTSKWATASRRFASVALPLVVLPLFVHRAGAMSTLAFEIVEALGLVLAVLAILAALVAFVRIWITGDKGWGRAVIGFIIGAACLAPAGLLAADFLRYPVADEVTTDPLNPPPLLSAIVPVPPSAAVAARLAAAFPNLKPRTYPIDPATVFSIVGGLVADDGWQVLRENEPDDGGNGGQINALTMSVFGFRDEVSIRLDPTADGTAVAVRSASLGPLHEPGAEGRRVQDFLAELDSRITAMQQGQPAGSDNAAPVPAPPPPQRLGKR
jgi:hypothetical protein